MDEPAKHKRKTACKPEPGDKEVHSAQKRLRSEARS